MSNVIELNNGTVDLGIDRGLVRRYFDRIEEGLKGVASQMLKVGKAVAEAEAKLPDLDLQKLKSELGANGVMSHSTWSKFKKIGEKAVLHSGKHAKLLPANWTTIYEMVKIPDDKLQSAFDENRIHPEIQRSQIQRLWSGRVGAGSSVTADYFRLGEVRVPKDLDLESVLSLTKGLHELVGKCGAAIEFAEKHRKEYVLKMIGENLRKDLESELSRMRGKNISPKKMKVFDDTMHQLRKHQETGKYPYQKTDSTSIENPSHEFFGYDLSKLNRKLLDEKIITQYSDVTYFTKEEGKLKCVALGYLYCDAENGRQRLTHVRKLRATVKAGKQNAKFARDVLEQIGER